MINSLSIHNRVFVLTTINTLLFTSYLFLLFFFLYFLYLHGTITALHVVTSNIIFITSIIYNFVYINIYISTIYLYIYKYNIYYMIIIITGISGSFKTTLLTKFAIESYLLDKKPIYTNYKLFHIKTKKLDLLDMYINKRELSNIVCVADELYTFMDCRMSHSIRNILESYLIAQFRKKNNTIVFTVQFSAWSDKRILQFIDYQIKMENKYILVTKKYIKNKALLPFLKKYYYNGNIYYKIPHPYLAYMIIKDWRDINNITEEKKLFDGRKWFKYFDTNEPIYPPNDYELKEFKKMNRNVKKDLNKQKSNKR